MWDWIEAAAALKRKGEAFAVVTVIAAKGSTPREAGAKMLVRADGSFVGTVGGGQLEKIAIDDARAALESALGGTRKYPLCFRTGQCCGGSVEVLVEVVGAGPELYVFGVGHVGQALLQVMDGTAFRLVAIDERPAWIDAPELPASVARWRTGWADAVQRIPWDDARTHVVIMTHDHALDLDVARAVVERPARYLGLIGSGTKAARFRQRLAALGATDLEIERLRCPIGLGAWGKAPREVAVSVAAELLALQSRDA